MDEYMRTNRELWDKLAKVHEGSEFYDVKGFLAGEQTLDPLEQKELTSYADHDAETGMMKSYECSHPISRIINALTGVGLRIEFFNEYAETSYRALPFMIKRDDDRYVIPGKENSIPLMFSLKAIKSL